MVSSTAPLPRPILMGECLLDIFPSGTVVLGGAPFNVAWHLQALGLNPLLISRVGDDDNGRYCLEVMQSWGLDTQGIQIDTTYPTGTVQVTLAEGQPTYTILANQAYDFIEVEPVIECLNHVSGSLLLHGTLATRTPFARQVLRDLQQQTPLKSLLDLNLRDPWWDYDWIEEVLHSARSVKMNHPELAIVTRQEQIPLTEVKQHAQALRAQYNLDLLVVTLGEQGAVLCVPDSVLEHSCQPVEPLVDTVGAGDAFMAMLITGLQRDWPLERILNSATQFASRFCQIPGAISTDPVDYQGWRNMGGAYI